MKKTFLKNSAFALLLASGTVFAQNVAIVNGKAVPSSRIDALAAEVAKSGRPVTPEIKAQLKDEVIAREYLYKKRKAQCCQQWWRQNSDGIGAPNHHDSRFVCRLPKSNPVTDADIKAEYDKFAAANSGQEYKARHILVEKADAKAIMLNASKKAQKFEDIAKSKAKDPGALAPKVVI